MSEAQRLGDEFLEHAKEYLEAAERLGKSKNFPFNPTYFCALRSIELGLKAHLAHDGVTERQLSSKRLGHDLPALLKEIKDRGILNKTGLSARDTIALARGSADYDKKRFEYPYLQFSTLPLAVWIDISHTFLANSAAS